MSDFVPPEGPPPPKVPKGWVAKWDSRYNEFFYVNLYTKKSTWEKPTEAAELVDGERVASSKSSINGDRPPSYHTSTGAAPSPRPDSHSDERGAAQSYYQQNTPQPTLQPPPTDQQKSSGSGGLGGKISKFLKSHSPQPRPHQQYYGNGPPQGYYQQPQQPYYGQGYGGPGYGPGYGQQPGRKAGGGMGMMGGAALGLGGGLLGGMLLEDAIDSNDNDYQNGQGGDFGGGGDFDGGDFGGDF